MAVVLHVGDDRADDRFDIDAWMFVERLVLGRQERVDHPAWDRLDGNEDAVLNGILGE